MESNKQIDTRTEDQKAEDLKELLQINFRGFVKLCVQWKDETQPDLTELIPFECPIHGFALLKGRCNHIGIYTTISKSGRTPRPLNISSPVYLGVTIAEKLLSKVFKDVQVMPYGNKGYDIICNQGYLIDIKSSTINKDGSWYFGINKNMIADYFLCIAFDDRINLNPLHLWLIPGYVINHSKGKSIKPVSLNKWSQYELTGKNKTVVSCCNILKGRV